MQALVIILSAACDSFDYGRLPPSGVDPCTLLLLQAAHGRPGLYLLLVKNAKGHSPTYLLMIPPAPLLPLVGHTGARKYTFIK